MVGGTPLTRLELFEGRVTRPCELCKGGLPLASIFSSYCSVPQASQSTVCVSRTVYAEEGRVIPSYPFNH